jgi:hypothetical protein
MGERRLDLYPHYGKDELLFDWAVQGFTSSEEAYVEEVAAHPGFVAYRLVARAPDMDYWGARYDLSPVGDASSHDPWRSFDWDGWWWSSYESGTLWRYGPQRASLLRVALRVSQGRYGEAEAVLREIIAVGLRLWESHPQDRGFWHASFGAEHLEWLYTVMGRERDARRLGANYDSVQAIIDRYTSRSDSRGVPQRSLADLRKALVDGIQDSTLSLRTRWGLASVLSLAPCTNLRELLFGPGPETRAAIEQARQALGRFPSDEAVFELMRLSLQSDAQPEPYTRHFARFVRMSTRVSGWVFGSRRIRGCMYHLSYELTW